MWANVVCCLLLILLISIRFRYVLDPTGMSFYDYQVARFSERLRQAISKCVCVMRGRFFVSNERRCSGLIGKGCIMIDCLLTGTSKLSLSETAWVELVH